MQYWESRVVKDWLFIFCPSMEVEKLPLGTFKRIIKEMKEIETELKGGVLKGWVAHTKLENTHIIRMLAKRGAVPYRVDLENDIIWFQRGV